MSATIVAAPARDAVALMSSTARRVFAMPAAMRGAGDAA